MGRDASNHMREVVGGVYRSGSRHVFATRVRLLGDRATLCLQLGKIAEARASYEKALRHVRQQPERRFLQRRLEELPG